MDLESYETACQLCQQGHYERAADLFRRVGGAAAAYGEAYCYALLGRADEAREAAKRCLATDPDHEDAKVLLRELTSDAEGCVEAIACPTGGRQLLSARRNRSFVGRCEYPTEASLADALRSAKEALPEVTSACDAARWGRATATLLLTLAWPFVTILLAVLCAGLAVGFVYLADWLGRASEITAEQTARVVGLVGIALDALLALALVCMPGLAFARIGRFLRARQPRLGAFLSAVAVLPISALLFLPLLDGESIAPTNMTFGVIPLRWLIVTTGFTVVPVLAALFAQERIARQRFCRVSGRLLSAERVLDLAFDCAEDAVELLGKGTYEQVAKLAAVPVQDDRHSAQVVLWRSIRADTSLLELKVFFCGQATVAENATRLTRAKWLAFSAALDRDASDRVCATFPA